MEEYSDYNFTYLNIYLKPTSPKVTGQMNTETNLIKPGEF